MSPIPFLNWRCLTHWAARDCCDVLFPIAKTVSFVGTFWINTPFGRAGTKLAISVIFPECLQRTCSTHVVPSFLICQIVEVALKKQMFTIHRWNSKPISIQSAETWPNFTASCTHFLQQHLVFVSISDRSCDELWTSCSSKIHPLTTDEQVIRHLLDDLLNTFLVSFLLLFI